MNLRTASPIWRLEGLGIDMGVSISVSDPFLTSYFNSGKDRL